ncbi:MAG: hypothetical protein WC256_09345, partial [Desulfurivibrionaceae bacterium]
KTQKNPLIDTPPPRNMSILEKYLRVIFIEMMERFRLDQGEERTPVPKQKKEDEDQRTAMIFG